MKIQLYELIYLGTAVGFVAGLIPLVLGLIKKKAKYGILGLLCSTIGGLILGIYLILPVLIVFIWLILRKDTGELSKASDNGDIS
jgi:ABC-type tungstate transport system substrate-binding protein